MTTKPRTIGQGARRTGISIKTLREYDHLGLLDTRGRSESNYRLLVKLWCGACTAFRPCAPSGSPEIQAFYAIYLEHPSEPLGPHLAGRLNQARLRTEAQLRELPALSCHESFKHAIV